MPTAAVLDVGDATSDLIADGSPTAVARLGRVRTSPLRRVEGGWDGGEGSGPVFLSTEFDDAWTLEGSDATPATAFGWATSFGTTDAPVEVRYGAQLPATIQAWLLAVVWGAALWITRKPVAR
jgi:hypothetical protein